MAVRLSAFACRSSLTLGRFLVLISVRGSVSNQGHSADGMIMPIEKSNELIGNRTRDLPTCSVVPQQSTPQCAPDGKIILKFISNRIARVWGSTVVNTVISQPQGSKPRRIIE
jgi:hypothetical protein